MYTNYMPAFETFPSALYNADQTIVNGNYPLDGTQYGTGDERFFGFGLLPFVAGLAIGPLLFNRPCCPPPFPPYLYPPPYLPPPFYGPPAYPPPVFNQQNINPVYGGLTENININMKNAMINQGYPR